METLPSCWSPWFEHKFPILFFFHFLLSTTAGRWNTYLAVSSSSSSFQTAHRHTSHRGTHDDRRNEREIVSCSRRFSRFSRSHFTRIGDTHALLQVRRGNGVCWWREGFLLVVVSSQQGITRAMMVVVLYVVRFVFFLFSHNKTHKSMFHDMALFSPVTSSRPDGLTRSCTDWRHRARQWRRSIYYSPLRASSSTRTTHNDCNWTLSRTCSCPVRLRSASQQQIAVLPPIASGEKPAASNRRRRRV